MNCLLRKAQNYEEPLPSYKNTPQSSYNPKPLMPYRYENEWEWIWLAYIFFYFTQLPWLIPRYGYAVKDNICNDFNQQETSDGSQVSGQYSVLLPDGRVLTVTYTVTPESGYVVSNILEMKMKMMKMIFTLLQAEVKYSEGPICETPPSYQQPEPSYQIDGWFKLPNVPHKLNKQFNVISM